MSEDNLIIVKEALTTIASATNLAVKKLTQQERYELEDILDSIEGKTTKIREKVKQANWEEEKKKIVYHESHNDTAPAVCGKLWKDAEKEQYEKVVLWYQWEAIKKRQRCRMCRIGNREIKGTQVERDKLYSDIKRSRTMMGWD